MQLLTVVVPDARPAQQGRRAGPAQDQPVHALRHDRARRIVQALLHRDLARGPRSRSGAQRRRRADPGWGFQLMTMLTLTTGTAFIMWLGEQITERGIGNGISLIIFAGIVADMPDAHHAAARRRSDGRRRAARPSLLIVAHRRRRSIAAICFFERGAAPDPGPVRQAHGRPEDVRRAADAPAAQDQRRRRHPADLRVVDPACSRRRSRTWSSSPWMQEFATALQPGDWRYNVVYVGADHLLRVLLHRGHVQPGRRRGQPEEAAAASSPASARARRPPSTSTAC